MSRLAGLLAALIVWPLAVHAQPEIGASAQLHDGSGRLLASAALRETASEVQISLTFPDRVALAGMHALHVHETGRCDPPSFVTSGGIFNPFSRQHGLKNSDGPMAGDLANLAVGPAGVSIYNLSAPLVTLRPGPASLLQPKGTSLVIFEKADDDRSQPDGNAGARIACGVIVAGTSAASTADTRPGPMESLLIGLMGVLVILAGVVLRSQRSA